jgi:hypothetical protein
MDLYKASRLVLHASKATEIPESTVYSQFSNIERQRFFDAHIGWDSVTEQLRQELEQVSELAVFGEFDVKNRMENIKLLENAAPAIENVAPHLSKMLRLLDHPRWARDKPEEVQLELQHRHLLMFSIMCGCAVESFSEAADGDHVVASA